MLWPRIEYTKWDETVFEAAEIFKNCSFDEQQEILQALSNMVDVQKQVLARHPASFQAWATNDTSDAFL